MNEAVASVVTTLTFTRVVPNGSSIVSLVLPSTPFTRNVSSVRSSLRITSSTVTVTSMVSLVSPSAAVTVTVTVFSPAARSTLPSTVYEANGSVVTAITAAARVPAGRVTAPPVASWPPTVNDSRVVSTFGATLKIKRYVATDVS